jgi:hypothetical protein
VPRSARLPILLLALLLAGGLPPADGQVRQLAPGAEQETERQQRLRERITADLARLDAQIDSLPRSTPGVVDTWFIGFAGFAGQSVFRNEALYARDVFARRLGTGPRSVLLVNDDRAPDAFPLASVSTLRHAVLRVAERMDLEEDVLVVMLTSHGSAEEGLEVTLGDLPLTGLKPAHLRAALEEAGVKWRMVVASACFSGTFAKALRGEHTAVVTAADARHSSFGCEDQRELTWFGEAFFRDGLDAGRGLEAAYTVARRSIRDREAQEGLPHSNPQLAIGRSMRAKLQALEGSGVDAAAP